jgi:hypothetical protein
MAKAVGDSEGSSEESKSKASKQKLVNFSHIFEAESLEIKTREHADERVSRLRRDEADAEHQRKKDFVLFVIVAVQVSVVAIACL